MAALFVGFPSNDDLVAKSLDVNAPRELMRPFM